MNDEKNDHGFNFRIWTGFHWQSIFDTDPIMEPYKNGSVIFYENGDGTATVGYSDENGKGVRLSTNINVYSDIIQPTPDRK